MATGPSNSTTVQLARQFGVPVEKVAALEAVIRPHYPGDEMMIELRLVRTLSAVRDGAVSIDAAIAEFGRGKSVA